MNLIAKFILIEDKKDWGATTSLMWEKGKIKNGLRPKLNKKGHIEMQPIINFTLKTMKMKEPPS